MTDPRRERVLRAELARLLAGLKVPGRRSFHVALAVGPRGCAAWIPGLNGPRGARGYVYAETVADALAALVKDVRGRALDMRAALREALR